MDLGSELPHHFRRYDTSGFRTIQGVIRRFFFRTLLWAIRSSKDFGNFRLYHGRRGGTVAYAVTPVALEGCEGCRLHLLFPRSGSSHPEAGFALDLAVIGMVIALLVIPVSRFISKPINELRHSAERIAQGGTIRAQNMEQGFSIRMQLPEIRRKRTGLSLLPFPFK